MSLFVSSLESTQEVSSAWNMPSTLHEELILLFRNHSGLAAELLKRTRVDVPEYTEIQIESEDLTDLKPATYRADLVLLLLKEKQRALGIIVEIQLSVDADKKYTWPAYLVNLRARIRCPVYLLIVAVEGSVARWAGRPIELGGDSRIVPWVMGPDNIPVVTDSREAEEDVELAVLSVRAHSNDPNTRLAARIATTAVMALAGIDAERAKMYFDMIERSLTQAVRRELQSMSPVYREYQSDFARHYIAQGRAEGEAQGRAEGQKEGQREGQREGRIECRTAIILRLLALRFGPLTESIQTRVREACSEESESISDSVLMAKTLEEALDAL